MKAGDTFLTPPWGETGKHLWVVASDPKKNSEQVLVVNLTGQKGHASDDPTCVLVRGDHPYIAKNSYIRYEGARFMTLEALLAQVECKTYTPHDPFTPAVLRRIQQGFADSPFSRPEQRALLIKQGLARPR